MQSHFHVQSHFVHLSSILLWIFEHQLNPVYIIMLYTAKYFTPELQAGVLDEMTLCTVTANGFELHDICDVAKSK